MGNSRIGNLHNRWSCQMANKISPLLGLNKTKMCLWSVHVSPGPCASTFFPLQFIIFWRTLWSVNAKYTRYHHLQNVLASINHHILNIESWKKSGIIF
jgi:hypothetical protein